MANYYSECSFMIDGPLSEAELAWLEQLREAVDNEDGAALRALGVDLEDDDGPLRIVAEQETAGLWLHEEENFSVEHAVAVVQAFLVRFRPDQHVSFMWANTCSKPRLDGYSGGACVVSATDYRAKGTAEMVDQLSMELACACSERESREKAGDIASTRER